VEAQRGLAAPEPGGVRSDESLGSVLAALAANTAIAVAKGVAAALTGSPALLAETLHTVADAGNEVLLFVSIRRSRHPADATHPFGYGPERYYWALLAAIGMFVVGGAVSIWDGIRALIHPPELEAFWVGVAVLLIALVLDGLSGPSPSASSGPRPRGAGSHCASCCARAPTRRS
jgi:cation diffusion facilitator family transporter